LCSGLFLHLKTGPWTTGVLDTQFYQVPYMRPNQRFCAVRKWKQLGGERKKRLFGFSPFCADKNHGLYPQKNEFACFSDIPN
jgi:hypothetical protein